MTSKEHFDLAINHKQPDRLVVDFGSTSVTGIHVKTVESLRKHFASPYFYKQLILAASLSI